MLNALRNLHVDRMDMDEAVALAAFGKTLAAEYAEHQMESPQWIGENLELLNREISNRRRDELRRQLKEARLRMDSLKTMDEKRSELSAKIERLEASLG